MAAAARFNCTRFSRWINAPQGRVFRLAAATALIGIGLWELPSPWGVAALVWAALPLSAGLLDWCWISAALRGPLTGRAIRDFQATN